MQKQENDLTAKSWILLNFKTKAYIRGENINSKRQIASITKMYTLYTCLMLNDSFNINPDLLYVEAIETIDVGTLANILPGKYITLADLYYGLMLPSGNDAALVLAIYYGNWLSSNNYFPNFVWNCSNLKKTSLASKKKYFPLYTKKFMHFVNQQLVGKVLKHKNTHFQNPHGLASRFQHSTAWEVAEAAALFLQEKRFAKISKAVEYLGEYLDGTEIKWGNTNSLLKQNDGYLGVKTGQTPAAGNCLCSFKVFERKYKLFEIVAVVLGCKSQQLRFTETKAIIYEYRKYLAMMDI